MMAVSSSAVLRARAESDGPGGQVSGAAAVGGAVLRLPRVAARTTRRVQLPRMAVGLLAAVAGCVGGIYGIGGGSILPPVLVADG
jgi:uncharacterized protein